MNTVVREDVNGRMVCSDSTQQVVDMHYNQQLIEEIASGRQYGEGTLLCVHWEGESAYFSHISMLAEKGFSSDFFARAFVCQRESITELIKSLYDECDLKLSRVKVHPFSLLFQHEDKKLLFEEAEPLRERLKRFYRTFNPKFTKLGLKGKTTRNFHQLSEDCQHFHTEIAKKSHLNQIKDEARYELISRFEEKLTEHGEHIERSLSKLKTVIDSSKKAIQKVFSRLEEKLSMDLAEYDLGDKTNNDSSKEAAGEDQGERRDSDTVELGENEQEHTEREDSNTGEESINQSFNKSKHVSLLPKNFQYPKEIPSSCVEDYRKTLRDTGVTIDSLDPDAVIGDPRTVLLTNLATSPTRPSKAHVSKTYLGTTKHSQDTINNLLNSDPFTSTPEAWIGVADAFDDSQKDEVMSKMGTDTVVCIHSSGGLGEGEFTRLKEIVLTLLGGLEDVARKHRYSENVALVALGKKKIAVKHLSKNYVGIRQILASIQELGEFSLMKALIFSLVCLTRSGVCTFGGISVPPRIVIMTDGMSQGEKEKIDMALRMFGSDHVTKVLARPIIWIPIGNANQELIRHFAAQSKGTYLEPNNIKEIVPYQKVERITADVLAYMLSTGVDPTHEHFIEAFEACARELLPMEKEVVANNVAHQLCKLGRELGETDNFDNIVLHDGLLPLGTRVVRGPDWRFADKDSGLPGTVVNHATNGEAVWVLWDNFTCAQYGYSQNAGFHVIASDNPRQVTDSNIISIGELVERGPSWRYRNEDGGHGKCGVVIRQNGAKVKVRWPNGSIYSYTFTDGSYEVWRYSRQDSK